MVTLLIEAVATMFAQLFVWRSKSIENQATSEIIDDKKDAEKANIYAENAIEIAQPFMANLKTSKERKLRRSYKRFMYFVKKFRRYK